MPQITISFDADINIPNLLAALSGACPNNTSVTMAVKDAAAKTGKPAEKPAKSAPKSEQKADITLTDLRSKAAPLSQKQPEAFKELLAKYGAAKLTGVPAEHYEAFMADLVAANG